MPIQHVPGSDLTYHLISYDKHGQERRDDPDGAMSELAAAVVRDQPITDLFVASHGWKGDVAAAIEQYDKWIGAMAGCTADRAAIRAARPGFQALIVGFHWPSQPWGDEEFGMGGGAFAVSGTGTAMAEPLDQAVDRFVEQYADRIADTPRARAAIRTIVDGAIAGGPAGDTLPADVAAAYAVLSEEAEVRADGRRETPAAIASPSTPTAPIEMRASRRRRRGAPACRLGRPGCPVCSRRFDSCRSGR